MTTLYNLHTDGDQYRITKFIDGNPEASYLLSHTECQCPAGHRPTCRHRQMLPAMLLQEIANTHWFFDWDGGKVVTDINGTLKQWIDDFSAKDTEQDTLPTIATYIELPANADVAKEFAKLLEASPDANCHTLPNGDCVSEGPCMHTPTPTPKQSWRRI